MSSSPQCPQGGRELAGPLEPQDQDKGKSTASYHQMQWYFGWSLGRNLLPQAPSNVAHGCARNLVLSGELYLPIAVDGSLIGIFQS